MGGGGRSGRGSRLCSHSKRGGGGGERGGGSVHSAERKEGGPGGGGLVGQDYPRKKGSLVGQTGKGKVLGK